MKRKKKKKKQKFIRKLASDGEILIKVRSINAQL